ncbi:MAG: PAS domain S-box protein [Methanococcaceae archaeon]|jgi:PAS domain S-box-containing protein
MKFSSDKTDFLKLKRAVESSGEAIFITDQTGIITYINPEFSRIYGYTAEEVIGKVTPRILKSGSMSDDAYVYLWNEILNKRVVKGEYLNKLKDGTFITIEGSANAILDENDQVIGFLAIQRDISERKLIESSLRESEEKFRVLIENLPLPLVIYAEEKIVFVNNECLNLFHVLKKEDLLGRSPIEFVHPDYIGIVKARMLKSSVERVEQGPSKQKYIRPDGSCVVVEVRTSPVIYENKKAVQVILLDVTDHDIAEKALKEANQFNRQIIQSAREGIVVYDRELKYQVWNPFMENLTGLKASCVVGKHPDDLFPFLNDNGIIEQVKSSLHGETVSETDFDFNIKSTGKSGWVSDSTAPLVDTAGEIIGVIRTIHDITKRKQSEIECLHAKNKAEENDRLKTAFLCNMSHEIRTPMNGIYGFSQLLIKDGIPKDKREMYSESITNCCDQLLNTVNNILDISKIETGQMETDLEAIDVNSLIKDTFTLHNITASEKKLNLVTSIDPKNRNCIIQSDKFKIQQILNNLINNALKFTDKGYVKFGYRVVGFRIQFFVEDSGIGISPEFHDIIFERFRQVESGLSRNYGGVGLGLAISRDLVQLLGGEMWVSSKPGTGSTFFFSLPYIPADRMVKNYLTEDILVLNKKITVLIAEDSYLNYIFIKEVLSGDNYIFLHAANGKEAVDICKKNEKIDIILMDIFMPVMDGYEATRQIKTDFPGIPIVAQTASAIKGEKERALQSGFDGYLSKPIRKNDLIITIKKFVCD